jgi:hypothetical protein
LARGINKLSLARTGWPDEMINLPAIKTPSSLSPDVLHD